MNDTERLTAIIEAMENDYPYELGQMKPADIAARLVAAGVRLDSIPVHPSYLDILMKQYEET